MVLYGIMMDWNSVSRLIIVTCLWICCNGLCTFPSYIRGTWISSEKNELSFADQYFTGYQVYVYSTDNFTCQESDGTKYMVKSESFSRYGLSFYAYMCLEFVEEKTDLYVYYKASAEEADANNERVAVRLASLGDATFQEVCTLTSYTGVRYSVLLKSGSIDDVKSTCPIPLLGNFAYTFNAGSGEVCNTSASSLTVCPAKNKMVFDYTSCSQIQAYSAGGELNCVYSSSSDGVYTTHVYNLDATTDQSTTYRFTCYLSTGYKNVFASQYPGDCPSAMNYTYSPSPGAVLTLYASEVCAYDEDDALSAGVIAAIVIICVLIVIIIVIALIYYFYKKRQKRKQEEWEAANRKVDPDELSPNMRLGLPDESRYDLDRLMYSPDMKNGGPANKTPRRDMSIAGLQGYNEAALYLDEDQRQTALESQMYTDKRKRKDNKDEFGAALPSNKVFSNRIKDLAKGRRRPAKMTTLAKLSKLKPKARPLADTSDGSQGGRGTRSRDIVVQVEEADGPGRDSRRKTRFADEQPGQNSLETDKQAKPLEDIETLSDIADNEMGVDDLSEDEKEPRLRLLNLKSPKKSKRKQSKHSKGHSSRTSPQQTHGMPLNTRFMPHRVRAKTEPDFTESMTIHRAKPSTAAMTPLARIHRKDNPRAWKEMLGGADIENLDLEELKKNLPENRWKHLLEELYRDKKYFDYVKESTSKTEKGLFTSADASLQYLYGRALFWEQKEPLPTRPPSHIKRMYSRYENTKSPSKSLQRSSTTMSRSGYKRAGLPRTPSTQVSKLKKREMSEKAQKEAANRASQSLSPTTFFEGGTQTEFSPIPSYTPDLTPFIDTPEVMDKLSLPGSFKPDVAEKSFAESMKQDGVIEKPVPPMQTQLFMNNKSKRPITREVTTDSLRVHKEVTRSDIKLEEVDPGDDINDDDRNQLYILDDGFNVAI